MESMPKSAIICVYCLFDDECDAEVSCFAAFINFWLNTLAFYLWSISITRSIGVNGQA